MMKYLSRMTLTLLGTAALAACGSNRNADQNAPVEMSANGATNASAAEAANPYADAERRMDEAMMAAVGSDVGQTWARKMIAHHQGAIDMSNIVLKQNPPADVAMMARDAISKNQKDIDDIRKLVKEGAPDPKSAELFRAAMMDEKAAMSSAMGKDLAQTYMLKMLPHHQGAVALSDVALRNGVSGAMRAQVEKTKAMNQKDAQMVEGMLNGKPMPTSSHEMNMSADMNGSDMNGMNHM
ncbi:MAG: DUF305 domain-containing protein [Bacillota bacterium]